MTKRAAIYARISKADKKAPKVANQIALCTALAEEHGYEVVATFEDDGIAASGKAIDDTTLSNRPGALRLLEAMRAGEFDVLLAVEGERLARTYLDGLDFIRASATGGVTWHLDTDGPLDPSTPAGEETAVSIFASGRREGRVRDARQKRRYDRELASGVPLWGTRPFGYEDDRITLRPVEADLIREAATDYLSGARSMVRIAHDWTEAGVLTDGMKRSKRGRDGVVRPARQVWTATAVRQVLQRDRNAGLLVHRGAELPNSQIQAIVTPEQLDEMKSRVKAGTPVGARAQTLLGGVLRCECGSPMHGTVSYSQRRGGPRHVYKLYKCAQTLYDKSQRHASIQQNIVDEHFVPLIMSDLYNQLVKPPKPSSTGSALQAISSSLSANGEALGHLDDVLLDSTFKRMHPKAKAQMVILENERAELVERRDALLAQTQDDGSLEAALEELRSDSHSTGEGGLEGWLERLSTAWNDLPTETKQAWLKSRYRPVVKVGGRGVERITLNPA